MPFDVGAPGHLIRIAHPNRGIEATSDDAVVVHQSLRGGRTVDRMGRGRRTYRLPYQWLTREEFALVEGLRLGVLGKPPFLLFDSARTNHFTANQSSGGDQMRDLTGFYADAVTPMALSVVTSEAWVGQASVQVAYAYTVPDLHTLIGFGNYLGDTGPSDPVALGATPVLPSTQYTASVYGTDAAGNGSTVELLVRCYKADGTRIATTFAGTATALTGSWTRLAVTFTTPSDVQFVGLEIRKAASASTGALAAAFDGAQLEAGASASAWVPGTGVPWVSPLSLSDTYRLMGWHDADLILAEVG